MKRRTFLQLGAGTIAGGTLAACGGGNRVDGGAPPAGQAPRSGTVTGWTASALQAVRATRPGPPMAARSLAIMATCMYNAWCAYDAVALPTRAGQPARRPPAERGAASQAAAISFAAHAALVDQFPAAKPAFDAYLASLGLGPAPAQDDGSPSAIGTAVARAELAYCHADGANQLGDLAPGGVAYADYTGYMPRNPAMAVGAAAAPDPLPAPGNWQPLSYADAAGVLRTPAFVGAAWSRIRPFALSAADQYRPRPPAAFGSAEFREQVLRIVEVQAGLSDEQKVIAEYWADGPDSELPPGHWLLFASFVSARDRHADDDDVKLFFALANALSDAAIAAWDAKRAYDSVRPITAVRHLLRGQLLTGYGLQGPAGGLGTIQAEAWVPYQAPSFPTPPFPEHVSGHSSFSAAAAEVLRRFTGADAFGASATRAAGSVAIEPGVPASALELAWPSFSAAAEQAGMSRIYGGIHFDNGNAAGLALGRLVGARAFARAQGLWQGQA